MYGNILKFHFSLSRVGCLKCNFGITVAIFDVNKIVGSKDYAFRHTILGIYQVMNECC